MKNHTIIHTLHSRATLPTAEILSCKNAPAWVSMDFTLDKYSASRAIEKMKILGAKQHCTANPAHLPQNWAKLAKLAKLTVLFSW